MRTAIINTVLIGILSWGLSGCSLLKPYNKPMTQGTIINQEDIDGLQAGLTEGQVIALLGPAFGKDPYDPFHWEYVFYTTAKDFHPNAAKHIIVNFDQQHYVKNWKIVRGTVKINR